MNTGQVVGNLVEDVELKTFKNGDKNISVVNSTIAVNEKYGESSQTSYIDFTAYNKKAEVLKTYTKKGSKLGITGKLRTDSYTDSNNVKRKKTYIFVETIDLLDSVKIDNDTQQSQ